MDNYVCQTECYYGEHHFKVGDQLPPDWPPNKHFVQAGQFKAKEITPRRTAADDPRPTSMIIKRLKDEYNIDVKPNTSRKEVWSLEKQMDDANGKTVDPKKSTKEAAPKIPEGPVAPETPKTQAAPPAGDGDTGSHDEKMKQLVDAGKVPFCKMTPDELNGMTIKEIAAHCEELYGGKVTHNGINKADLIKKVVGIEDKFLG